MRLIQIKTKEMVIYLGRLPHGRSQTMTASSKVAWMIECRRDMQCQGYRDHSRIKLHARWIYYCLQSHVRCYIITMNCSIITFHQ